MTDRAPCAVCGSSSVRAHKVQLMGGNSKIIAKGSIGSKAASFEIPPGPGSAGGTCRMTTPACSSCYAQLGDIVFGSAGERRLRNLEVFLGDPAAWADAIVHEIAAHRPPIVRIHGFGDFFSVEYVRAWTGVCRRLPRVKFFGTTRMWQLDFAVSKDAQEFVCALDEFRALPNVYFGASLEGGGYNASKERIGALDPLGRRIKGSGQFYPGNRDKTITRGEHKGKQIADYLRGRGFNIWNMLSEFSDPVLRAGMNIGAASGKNFAQNATLQFAAAKHIGWLVGKGCPEQMRKVADCASCMHCLHKGNGTGRWDVTFAFHPGKAKAADDEERAVRASFGLPESIGAARKAMRDPAVAAAVERELQRRRDEAAAATVPVGRQAMEFDLRVRVAERGVRDNPGSSIVGGWVVGGRFEPMRSTRSNPGGPLGVRETRRNPGGSRRRFKFYWIVVDAFKTDPDEAKEFGKFGGAVQWYVGNSGTDCIQLGSDGAYDMDEATTEAEAKQIAKASALGNTRMGSGHVDRGAPQFGFAVYDGKIVGAFKTVGGRTVLEQRAWPSPIEYPTIEGGTVIEMTAAEAHRARGLALTDRWRETKPNPAGGTDKCLQCGKWMKNPDAHGVYHSFCGAECSAKGTRQGSAPPFAYRHAEGRAGAALPRAIDRCGYCGEPFHGMTCSRPRKNPGGGIVRSNPPLILVHAMNPPPPAELEAAWCRFHQRDEFAGKVVDIGDIPQAPKFTFALGRCQDIDLGDGPQKFSPRPWLVCSPDDDSLWIVSDGDPMRLGSGVAGRALRAVTYDPMRSSGKDPAYYRHKFDQPGPVLTPVGNPNECRAILLKGGNYRVAGEEWIHG